MKIKTAIGIHWISIPNKITLKQSLLGFKMSRETRNEKLRPTLRLNLFWIIAHLGTKNKKISAGFLVEEGDFCVHIFNQDILR